MDRTRPTEALIEERQAAMRERASKVEEMFSRAEEAAVLATAITDYVGFKEDGDYTKVCDARVSNPIATPDGSAEVFVHYDVEPVKQTQKNLFGFKKVTIEYVKTDSVYGVGIRHFTPDGKFTGSDEWFANRQDSEEEMTAIEESLQSLLSAVTK